MSRTAFIFLTAVLAHGILLSQDLIVPNVGDSIHCKIIKTKGEYIQFTLNGGDEIRKIPKEIVKFYQADFVEKPLTKETSGDILYQDLIITNSNDSLFCDITSISDDYIQ